VEAAVEYARAVEHGAGGNDNEEEEDDDDDDEEQGDEGEEDGDCFSMTREEALSAAAAEGLTLLKTNRSNASGFTGVYLKDTAGLPRFRVHRGGADLGIYDTAEGGALALARFHATQSADDDNDDDDEEREEEMDDDDDDDDDDGKGAGGALLVTQAQGFKLHLASTNKTGCACDHAQTAHTVLLPPPPPSPPDTDSNVSLYFHYTVLVSTSSPPAAPNTGTREFRISHTLPRGVRTTQHAMVTIWALSPLQWRQLWRTRGQ
jgi:hypothetical protein